MDPKKRSEIVAGTTPPPPPDPETLRREKEKRDKEELEKKEAPVKGQRGPKSNLVKAAESEAAMKLFREKCRKAGKMCCNSLVMTGYTFFGPEFAYIPPFKIDPNDSSSPVVDEKQRMEEAYADMFEAYGWDIIPPWIPVVTVTLSYGATRLGMETVKERFKKGFLSSIKDRIKNIGKKKEEVKA